MRWLLVFGNVPECSELQILENRTASMLSQAVGEGYYLKLSTEPDAQQALYKK